MDGLQRRIAGWGFSPGTMAEVDGLFSKGDDPEEGDDEGERP
jgi:hypothetical protein